MTKELSLMAVGDIFLGSPTDHPQIHNVVPLTKKRDDLYSWLENVAPILKQGAFTMGNLEGPISIGGEFDIAKAGTGGAVFKMPPEAAQALSRAGLRAVSLANNQSMNLGTKGILETIEYLKKAGVEFSGAGADFAEAHKPAIMERDGVRVALLSYTSIFVHGTNPAGENKAGLATVSVNTAYQVPGNIRYAPGVPPRIITTPERKDVEQMIDDVRRARTQADLVVVSWHWGLTKYANSFAMGIPLEDAPFFVLNYQEDMGRAAIDAGADVVTGHHPHALQGIEIYKGKPICYSLCNLVMSFGEGANFGEQSVILKGYIDPQRKQLTRFSLIPIKLPAETMEPHPVPIEEAADYITLMTRLSKKYGTKFRIEGNEVAVEAP